MSGGDLAATPALEVLRLRRAYSDITRYLQEPRDHCFILLY
jgi:hypothetical protein